MTLIIVLQTKVKTAGCNTKYSVVLAKCSRNKLIHCNKKELDNWWACFSATTHTVGWRNSPHHVFFIRVFSFFFMLNEL